MSITCAIRSRTITLKRTTRKHMTFSLMHTIVIVVERFSHAMEQTQCRTYLDRDSSNMRQR